MPTGNFPLSEELLVFWKGVGTGTQNSNVPELMPEAEESSKSAVGFAGWSQI